MYLFDSLNQIIRSYLPDSQVQRLQQAYFIAREAHEGQTRSSGEPYITHPVAVACILAEMNLDYETLIAALLHDVIEDTDTTYYDMEQLFGRSIAELIEGVSKLDTFRFRDKKEAQAENFRKMIMAMIQDIRVILIKLADRTHNMRTINSLRPDKKRRIAKETLEIYGPIAHRLGIHNIKTELEELGFKALYPTRYRVIKKIVRSAHKNRKEVIQKILSEIKGHLRNVGIPCRVSDREKYLYSIYCKMVFKEKHVQSMMDIYAFRVIVHDLDACYRVLGQMHSLYKPRPGCVKDYIAIPKVNGYQSLHTSMIGPHGVSVEVQIRTENMDQIAEMGIAAQWKYREHKETNTTSQVHAQRWMQSLMELQKSTASSFEFIESVKSDLFPNEIHVFSPEGHIVTLPFGATPIDFAYAVHTEIGHACVGACVDKKPYPLSQPLSNGQTVEIITDSSSSPDASWLNFVISSKARIQIRQLLKNLKRNNAITFRRYLFNLILKDLYKLTEIPSENIQHKLKRMQFFTLNNLLSKIRIESTFSFLY